ncbi:MAG TPA: carboxypeptidase regulatory-like domain-containing protein, partial [Burkholderiales bacterium]|nr:carboxypeptidase regulatory-like domain-containing protein [Burkholderiales bacterium]
MKKILYGALKAWLAVLLVSCGGNDAGGDSVDARPFAPPGFGRAGSLIHGLLGIVVDANTGAPVVGATVAAGSLTTTTDSAGNFTMPTIPNGTSVVSFTLAAYAPQSRTIQVSPTIETSLIVQMVPNGATTPPTFDPTAPTTLTVTGSTARVDINGGLRDVNGNPPPGTSVNAVVTPIGPSLDAYLLPGEFVVTQAAGGNAPFETFGAVDVRITDSAGNPLSGAFAAPASIRIPVDTRFGGALPASVALMRFDPVTGLWIEDGTATLQGVAPSQFYGGAISRIATWTAGRVYTPSNITVCVNDTANAPVGGARVYSDGIDYSGGGTAWTNAAGVAVVPMKRGGQAVISANSPRSSNSATISAGQSAADFTLTPCLIMPTAGMTIRLTWGSSPSDLDSHLKGPNNVHLSYQNRGSLTAAPFAGLDVDDTSSFGPEVITITRLTQGVHEYFVHN